jgi:hypothetical protein
MPDATAIRMQAQPAGGLYESFYFRGTSPDGNHAFWLKHNMLRHRGSRSVRMEGALILFDRAANRTAAVYSQQTLDGERFDRVTQIARDWEHVALELRDQSAVQIGRNYLGGHMAGEGGQARWDLQVQRSGLVLEPFAHKAMYRLPWPSNKLVTRDCHVDFHGSVWAGGLAFSGQFHGMNGHNWGTGHAHTYAYANCAQFRGREDAYFDGFTARVPLAGGLLLTPRLSIASLYTSRRWHRFNSLRRAARHPVGRLEDYAWQAEFTNDTHVLQVDIDGASPGTLPWAALHYEHPDRRRSVVKNTKFAWAKLRLLRRGGAVEDELFSDACELETLLPGNRPAGEGYVGTP